MRTFLLETFWFFLLLVLFLLAYAFFGLKIGKRIDDKLAIDNAQGHACAVKEANRQTTVYDRWLAREVESRPGR